jgi:hypothetical protein
LFLRITVADWLIREAIMSMMPWFRNVRSFSEWIVRGRIRTRPAFSCAGAGIGERIEKGDKKAAKTGQSSQVALQFRESPFPISAL